MKKKALLAVAGSLLLVPAMAQPAAAAPVKIIKECKKGGFTGKVRVTYTKSKRKVHRVEYKINKGDNRGGHSANVTWWDWEEDGAVSGRTDEGIQNNKWHTLREKNYKRGKNGDATIKFIFDKSLSGDPECSNSKIF